MYGWWTKKALRKIQNKETVYLTFDDGPDKIDTPLLLDLLSLHDAKATFFVISQKASKAPDLIERIKNEGHSLGDHSYDHSYRHFFSSYKNLQNWIETSQKYFENNKIPCIGFRPPAGVVTPGLEKVLEDKGLPLVLWNQRVFDTTFEFNAKKAHQLGEKISGGDIVLLHDCSKHGETNRQGVKRLIETLKGRGLILEAL